jgi:hypothetical protein
MAFQGIAQELNRLNADGADALEEGDDLLFVVGEAVSL